MGPKFLLSTYNDLRHKSAIIVVPLQRGYEIDKVFPLGLERHQQFGITENDFIFDIIKVWEDVQFFVLWKWSSQQWSEEFPVELQIVPVPKDKPMEQIAEDTEELAMKLAKERVKSYCNF
jgi:hypothetical protein